MTFFKKKQQTDIKKEELDKLKRFYEDQKPDFKSIIAPAALEIESSYLQIGNKYSRSLFVISYPRFLTTNWLAPVINFDRVFDISLFVHPVDSALVLRKLQKKTAEVQAQIAGEEEKGKVRNPILETALGDLEDLRDKLLQAREKLFNFGFYINIYADSIKELDNLEGEIKGMLESRLIMVKPAIFQQELGFNSVSPIASDRLEIHNYLNTAPLSTIFPFVSADLSSNKGILYGINRHNNSLIIFDRFSLENGNMVIFAKSGSGKSYTAKLEVLRSLMTGTEVIIIDPENEYKFLAETIGGAFLNVSLNSKTHINPFDLPPPLKDESPGDTLRSNIISLVGLLRIMIGGLTPEEDALVDRALSETYAASDITPDSDFTGKRMPLLQDFVTVLENMEGGHSVAQKLKKYTEGSFAGFLNYPTNVDVKNKLVVFSIRDMEPELRPIAMYVITHYIWNLVRAEMKKRVLLVDEAWWMMQHEDGASFLYSIAKRCRKYFLGLTTITQDVADFLESKYGKPIVTNSSIQLLLKQSPATIDVVKKSFNLTDEEKFLLLESSVGEGIFFAGLKHAAIKVVASYTEDQVITSDPRQLLDIEKAKKELETTT